MILFIHFYAKIHKIVSILWMWLCNSSQFPLLNLILLCHILRCILNLLHQEYIWYFHLSTTKKIWPSNKLHYPIILLLTNLHYIRNNIPLFCHLYNPCFVMLHIYLRESIVPISFFSHKFLFGCNLSIVPYSDEIINRDSNTRQNTQFFACYKIHNILHNKQNIACIVLLRFRPMIICNAVC